MTIVELFLALYVSDFTVPESEEIQETVKKMKECRALPEPTAECKNVIRQYLEMKEKIGRTNADIQ